MSMEYQPFWPVWFSLGTDTGMWVPSIASKHLETRLEFLTTVSISFSVGNLMKAVSKVVTIAEHVSRKISHTENREIANRCPTVLYLTGVAKHHNVIATCFCTEIQHLITLSYLWRFDFNLLRK